MLTLTQINTTTAALLGQLPICQAGNPWGTLDFNTVMLRTLAVLTLFWLLRQISISFRRSPGIDATFATKEELAAGLSALAESGDSRREEIEGKIENMRKSLTHQLENLNHRMEAATTAEGIKMEAIQRQLGEIIGELRARRPAGAAK